MCNYCMNVCDNAAGMMEQNIIVAALPWLPCDTVSTHTCTGRTNATDSTILKSHPVLVGANVLQCKTVTVQSTVSIKNYNSWSFEEHTQQIIQYHNTGSLFEDLFSCIWQPWKPFSLVSDSKHTLYHGLKAIRRYVFVLGWAVQGHLMHMCTDCVPQFIHTLVEPTLLQMQTSI